MKFAHLTALVALSLPFTALADDYTYSYAEAGYRTGELANDKGDGFDLKVNFLLGDLFYMAANIDEVEFDNDLHLDRFGLGFGAHFNAFYNIDLYAVVSYEDLEFDIPGATDFSDKGWGTELGARYRLNDQWEFKMAGDFVSYEDDATGVESQTFIGSAVYHLSNNYAVVGEYNGSEITFDSTGAELDENTFRVALRIQF